MDNHWRHGSRVLRVPPLPAHLQGSSGCLLEQAIFDADVGIEVYLAILEEPSWCLPLAATRPFKVFCKSGLAETKYGGMIFLLSRIAVGFKNEVIHQQFFNSDKNTTKRDFFKRSQQNHLQTPIIKSPSGR